MHIMRALLLIALISLIHSGCASDWHYRAVNELRARRAWSEAGRCDCGERHGDFGAGWRRGYFDVSTGRTGQRPILPPKRYWAASYQCPDGFAAIDAWYQGYERGVIAAECDGYGGFHTMPIQCTDFPADGPAAAFPTTGEPSNGPSSEAPGNGYPGVNTRPADEEIPALRNSSSSISVPVDDAVACKATDLGRQRLPSFASSNCFSPTAMMRGTHS
jgi:hypothetical protein